MPTPPLSDELANEAYQTYQRHGGKSVLGAMKAAAEELGLDRRTLRSRIQKYEERNDPAITDAKAAIGTNMTPVLVWAKTKSEDGTSYSALLKPDPLARDALEAIRGVLEGLTPVTPTIPPQHADNDLITVYPIADLHAGMMAWGRETGESYNTEAATRRLVDWIGSVISRSPKSGLGIVLAAGDLLHANDNTNATPASKHVLDVDTRHFKTLDRVIEAMAVSVDLALHHHEKVLVVVKPGNHDRDAYLAVLFGLDQRYRNEPRVTVEKEPSEFWAFQFGKVMLSCHHGDKAKAERMVLFLADEFPEMWGCTRYRFLFTGHFHHHKSQDIGGVVWEQLRAMTARDAYAASHAYSARAELQGITYHRDKGEVSRVKVTV